ncbi:MAG TPA: hypothetical protein VFF16_21475 [Telluria sp.]|nr:hypothetical protein [Telluria sp.]
MRAQRTVLACLGFLPGLALATEAFEINAMSANLGPPLAQLSGLSKPPVGGHRIIPYLRVTPQMRGQLDPLQLQGRASAPYSDLITWPARPPLPSVNTNGTPINVEGIPENGGAPSDANGAAGATQYVQAVNVEFAVYRKSDGALLLGPLPGNAFWAGMSGSPGADACRTNNGGDPIIKYDQLAHRWIATQPAWVGTNGPFYQCIAVSTSEDATGSYYRYVLPITDSQDHPVFNDYPKMGVWPDAYYFTFVLFNDTSGGYRGPRACGLDRAAMLGGGTAGGRCADFGDAFGPMLPSDVDGTMAPPAQSPAYLMSLDFDANGDGDHLFFWRISFGSNTLSGAITLPVAPFTIACPSTYGGPCIRQPAPGETLDALGDRLMYRLSYRNFGNRESLVVNHSVQQPGAAQDGPAGVRWYEVRNPAGAVQVYQQGSFAPDTDSRWMGSAAMDKMGNLAVGYSVSGPGTHPGIRYSGRLRTEPLGRLEQEGTIINGTGVQIDTFHRWGDYSALAADPVDDCTFWYTNQYIAASGSFNWHSRIASFAFKNCR